MLRSLLDYISKEVQEAVQGAVPNLVVDLIPQKLKIAAIERRREWGPYKVISTNHDLVRAVRISWVRAALTVIDAALALKIESAEFSVSEFAEAAKPALREIRQAAFNRFDAPGSSPIDQHAATILEGVAEYVHPGLSDPGQSIGDSAAAVLELILIRPVPTVIKEIITQGLEQTEGQGRRSFGELVFADFAEILKDPTRYPQAMPAFQIYLAGATKKLGEAIRSELLAAKALDTEALDGIKSLQLLGAQQQEFWLERFERAESLLMSMDTKLDDHAALLNAVASHVGVVDEQRAAALWQVFRLAYETKFRAKFDAAFPKALGDYGASIDKQLANGELFSLSIAPLIDAQSFKLVHADPVLTPLDCLSENKPWLQGSEGGLEPLAFDEIVDALGNRAEAKAKLRAAGSRVDGLRIAIVSSSGVGKTTTLYRLQDAINRGGAGLAVLLDFDDIKDAQGDTGSNLLRILPRILDGLGLVQENQSTALAILADGLEREINAGRLTILIDGLDHIGTTPRALTNLQDNAPWTGVNVVISGRPESFSDWRLLPSAELTVGPDLTRWQVVSPDDLTADQARAYLGGFDDPAMPNGRLWRYHLVSRALGDMLKVPRVLAHIRILTREQLIRVRTAADIYNMAIMNLLREGIKGLPERKGPAANREARLLGLLGALAFQCTFEGIDELSSDPDAQVLEDRLGELRRRTGPVYEAYEGSLSEDLSDLARLSAFVGNGLLEPGSSTPGTLRSVRWVNRTVSAFMVAFWLAKWASRAPVNAGEPPETDWFRQAVYYQYTSDSTFADRYRLDVGHIYQINLFLSEMPRVHIFIESWAGAATAWYDPALVRDAGRPGLWSTEMLARSWRTMHAIAGLTVDDWWDVSYDSLSQVPPGRRSEHSPHKDEPIQANRKQRAIAAQAISLFKGDFAAQGDADGKLGQLAPDGWAAVPSGSLEMGSPKDRQGFPKKTLAYWKDVLRRVEHCDPGALDDMAADVSPEWWWSGLQGLRQREEEKRWLVDSVFNPYRDALAKGRDREEAEQETLTELRNNFRREDETAEQSTQNVAGFEISVVPVSNRTFSLFSPGFVDAIRPEVEKLQATVALSEPDIAGDPFVSGWAEPDRPVIYATWFDAWAFCQWANWTEDGAPIGCRLPHEPEWEYACKRTPTCEASPFDQRYWWGDNFYADDDDFTIEHRSIPVAHSNGWPGATREASAALPNGFGLKDMIGNVWEWSANVYDGRTESEILENSKVVLGYSRMRTQQAPKGREPLRNELPPPMAASRTVRGGVWYYMSHIATAASRFRLQPHDADYKIGFRLVRERYGSEASAAR